MTKLSIEQLYIKATARVAMKRRRLASCAGFTLIEVSVAVAVFSLIIVMLAQMLATTCQAWSDCANQADNFVKGRAMLDLVVSDLQHAVLRPDLPVFQINGVYNPSNGGFTDGTYSPSFFTGVAGLSASPVSTISCVNYDLVTTADADKIKLQRSYLAIPWSNVAAIPFQGNLSGPLNNVVAQDVAPGVVGFAFSFRHTDGSVTSTYNGYNATNPVVAVGVSLAVVSSRSLTQMSVGNLVSIKDNLSSYVNNADSLTSVKALWDSKLTGSFFSPYPRELGTDLRTFERWIAPAHPF